ncbi:MAG: hypothetical protein GY917_15495 [Planctomycetaceae bacterium]|nr:hypothetical protein [Planctomycetaceae bacterium]
MLQRFIMVLVVVAMGVGSWTMEPLLAAPTKAQRTELNLISKDLLKAGNLYAQGKYKESGRLIRMVQGRLEKLAESKDPALHRLMGGTINGLKKAHALLEIEGVELPALKILSPTDKPPMPAKPADGKVSFVKQVAPVLVSKCGRCHVNTARGMFSMANFETLLKGTPEGVVIFPKDADGSRIIEVIESGDMPRGGLKVTPDELSLLKKWINEGAVYDSPDKQANLASLAPNTKAGEFAKVEVMQATGKETVSFSADIAPVLVQNCVNCHGLARRPSGRFDLNSFQRLLRGGESGPPVLPGKPAESLLIKKLKGTGGGQQMPLRKPPLPTPVIAKIEKWILEGAKFDGPDPDQSMGQVAALAKAKRGSHEQLSADRAKLAKQNWRLSMSGVQASEVESKNFLLISNLGEGRLAELAATSESIAAKVGEILLAPAGKPLIKGRMTLYVLQQRYDYTEFGSMVEKRAIPKGWRGHWKYNVVDAYAVVVPPRTDEYSVDALIAQQLGAAYVASLGNVPVWFSEGIGRVLATRTAKDDTRSGKWDEALSAVLAETKKPDAFLEGKLPPEDTNLLAYGFLKYLMRDSKKFGTVLEQVAGGAKFADVFSTVYRGSPDQIVAVWAKNASRSKR